MISIPLPRPKREPSGLLRKLQAEGELDFLDAVRLPEKPKTGKVK